VPRASPSQDGSFHHEDLPEGGRPVRAAPPAPLQQGEFGDLASVSPSRYPRSPPRPERHPRAPSPSICPESPVAIDTRASARRHRSPTTSTRQRLIGQSRRQRRLRQLAVGAMSAELTSPGKTAENEVTRLGRIVAGRRRIFLTSYATDTGVH
jgi:hypothetical protein